MNAETLREAAAKLRESAEAATGDRWAAFTSGAVGAQTKTSSMYETVAKTYPTGNGPKHNAAYIALVHPAVGLALADWLDIHATFGYANGTGIFDRRALTVARTILGGES